MPFFVHHVNDFKQIKYLLGKLTDKELKENLDEKIRLNVIIPLSLSELMQSTIEMNDLVEERILKSGFLEDISYRPVSILEDERILIEVNGLYKLDLDEDEE